MSQCCCCNKFATHVIYLKRPKRESLKSRCSTFFGATDMRTRIMGVSVNLVLNLPFIWLLPFFCCPSLLNHVHEGSNWITLASTDFRFVITVHGLLNESFVCRCSARATLYFFSFCHCFAVNRVATTPRQPSTILELEEQQQPDYPLPVHFLLFRCKSPDFFIFDQSISTDITIWSFHNITFQT